MVSRQLHISPLKLKIQKTSLGQVCWWTGCRLRAQSNMTCLLCQMVITVLCMALTPKNIYRDGLYIVTLKQPQMGYAFTRFQCDTCNNSYYYRFKCYDEQKRHTAIYLLPQKALLPKWVLCDRKMCLYTLANGKYPVRCKDINHTAALNIKMNTCIQYSNVTSPLLKCITLQKRMAETYLKCQE